MLIGHIGDFSDNKNREIIFSLIQQLKATKLKISFLFIGGNINEIPEKFKNYVNDFILISHVEHHQISQYYSAMDLLLLPSKYEGVPYTIIESQFNGLESIISLNIDKEVIFTDLVTSLAIDSVSSWSELIFQKSLVFNKYRNKYDNLPTKYNILDEIQKITSIYNS
jgi:glycosyltransferase involved in cell wall biosynthesis